MVRWLGALIGILLGFVVLVFAYFYVTAPQGIDPDTFAEAGEAYSVEIIRDTYGVPHIYGKTDADVAFGLAYAHGEDDFETIQDVILATRGQMATKLGQKGAITDFLIGFMGVNEAVEAGYQTAISAEARAISEAYAMGLNAFIADNKPDVSPHLLPVRGEDVVAGFTFKTPLFYGFDKALAKVFEGKYGDRLDMERASFLPAKGFGPETGSQGVAVAPLRSGGETLLLVNSHQPLTGPVAWYEARVKSQEGWDMIGGTFPGSPFILHGAGPALGWASTVNKPDLVDVYKLTINPTNENQYRLDGEWVDFETRTVAIDVKLFGPIRWTFNRTVKLSVFGPVIDSPNGAMAINWAGRGEIGMVDAYYALNKAQNRTDFEAALAMGKLPSINYVMADSTGDIGHYYNAMFPARPEGAYNWDGVVDGTNSAAAWSAYRPFSDMPRTVNPPSGAVYNANNSPVEATDGTGAPAIQSFPRSMGIQANMTNRAYRLKRLLKENDTIDFDTFRAIKYDKAYDPDSDVILTLKAFLRDGLPDDLANSQRYIDAFDHLSRWDFETDLDNRHAAIGVLTIFPQIGAQLAGDPMPPIDEGFKQAADLLFQHYQTVDVDWQTVSKLKRGGKSWPIAGGPDILRAVYGWPMDEDGKLNNNAGDSYILFARWDESGTFSATSVHSFGSATLNPDSPHFADQVPLFVEEREKAIQLRRGDVLKTATSVKRFGNYQFPSE